MKESEYKCECGMTVYKAHKEAHDDGCSSKRVSDYIKEFRDLFPMTSTAETTVPGGTLHIESFLTEKIEEAEAHGKQQGIQEAQQDYFEAGRQKGRDEAVDYIRANYLHQTHEDFAGVLESARTIKP